MFNFTERIITEGLGSLCPIVLNNIEYRIDIILYSLGLTNKGVNRLINNAELLIDKITEEFSSPLIQEKMNMRFINLSGENIMQESL